MNQSIVQINIPGDRVLRDVSVEVPEHIFNTPELEEILLRMKEALESEKDGVALAAPQIGISYRIFIVRYDRLMTPPEKPEESEVRVQPDIGVFINPEFVNISRKREEMDEGCLSVRGIYGKTYRHIRATVQAQDFLGNYFERGGGGILSQVFQHETDHLNGILFIDHALELHEPRVKDPSSAEIPSKNLS
jgi:peptide deformylase